MEWLKYDTDGVSKKIRVDKVISYSVEKSRWYGWFINFTMEGGSEIKTTGDSKYLSYVKETLGDN